MMNRRLSKLLVVVMVSLMLLAGLRLTLDRVSAAGSAGEANRALAALHPAHQNDLPEQFPIISNTTTQWAGISDNCIVFRDSGGGVYLHNLTTSQTLTITTEADDANKVVISQGVVVWRSEREGAMGLWGYYNPSCSYTGIFGSQIISPFHIISRTYAHAPALSGEMLTYMAWVPAGMWYIGLIELDANDNGFPDAAEAGYDPTADNLWVRLSCCASWPQGYAQVLPDIYWDNDYKVACWYDNAGGDHIVCYDLSQDEDNDGIPDWKDADTAHSWDGQFRVSANTHIDFDWQGIIAVHRDLVMWTDARDFDLSGYDLHIIDLDLDDDGILNVYDADFNNEQTEFVLVNRPWHQQFPDIWWPFAVWADWRNNNQPDIYAYDLSVDSDGDGILNWKDPNRPCLDPAELPVTFQAATQTTPELWQNRVIWEDYRQGKWDIYGAQLQPVQPQPGPPIGGTAQEKAIHWLDQQTIPFTQVQDIPGYITPTGLITRYKSFMQDGVEQVRRAWYPPMSGAYLVGFDYCDYGTPDQKRYLGRFGRGFIYDQGLALIVRTMLSQTIEAKKVGSYLSSFQNSGQLTTTTPGSFGFSFNGQGYWGEKDNFYDMDYLRGGANGWLGYGYLFYARHYSEGMQFTDVITRMGDYILSQQVLTDTDLRYGLFKGGYGSWCDRQHNGNVEWCDEDIEWVATEHNIDIYFFLRDLGGITGQDRYTNAANLLRDNMPKLWDDEKGRLHQGMILTSSMDITDALDKGDALDAASWGAMYWLATDELTKAIRSLEYADRTYSNTVTVSNTVTISPEITIWGYKPYTGTADGFDWSDVNLVWSEGSLGVAMANLKLGHALLDRQDAQGYIYIQKAKDIVTEMEKLQTLDPKGGVFYAAYPGDEIPDFPRAPSAAGITWFLMVQKAMENKALRDAFWGPITSRRYSLFLPLISKDT